MPADAGPLIEVAGVGHRFGATEVLRDVDLQVAPGEIVTLIGPNGSGKTTLVRIVLGLLRPDRGRVLRRPGLSGGYLPQRLHVEPAPPLTLPPFLSLAPR